MEIKKLFLVLLVLAVIAAVFCGCGADASLEAAYAEDYETLKDSTIAAAENGLSTESASSQTALPANQKLIRTVTLDAETEDMDALLTDVESRIAQLGGYVENRNVYNGKTTKRDNRRASLTIRIPADQLDQFVSQVSGISNVLTHNENTKDVTLNYVATESRITALQTEETRLLELLAMAESLEDLLVLEERLTDVRTELEKHKSQLKVYDNLVNYATVYLTVEEVVQYTEVEEDEPDPTFWERAWDGFVSGLKNSWTLCKGLVILVISIIPYLILPGCVLAIVLVVRAIHRRKDKKAEQSNPSA